jgi:phosphoribosylaminoimidazole-succinocarboxamide synthase
LSCIKFGRDTAAKQAGIDTCRYEVRVRHRCRQGNLFLIDEVLTPDSSRYWPAGRVPHRHCSPPSYDKQFVRDHLLAIKWDQKPPGAEAYPRM